MGNGFTVRLVIGLFVILLGLSLFLNQLGINLFGFDVFSLWPLLLIVFGIMMLLRRHFIGAMFFLVFGFAFLFSTVFNFSIWAVIWPVMIICVGISILFRSGRHYGDWGDFTAYATTAAVNSDRINESIVFWASDQIVQSQNFSGGKIDCVFGGFKLDLREAKLSSDGARLEINAVFGGGEILLPKDIRLELEPVGVMGGVSNRAVSSGKSEDKVLRLKVAAVFGGVEIKN